LTRRPDASCAVQFPDSAAPERWNQNVGDRIGIDSHGLVGSEIDGRLRQIIDGCDHLAPLIRVLVAEQVGAFFVQGTPEMEFADRELLENLPRGLRFRLRRGQALPTLKTSEA